MKQNYKYTAADFERYHSGRMSEAEMHAIEKAALQDAFLAEALEGYSYADTPEKDIDDLKEKLLQKKKKKSVFLVMQKQNVWLRIAAIFILIIGGGYLAYQLNFSNENNTLAKKEEKQDVQNDTKQIAIPPKDSINTEKEIVVTPFVTNETVINKANKKIVKDNKILWETATENTSDDMPKENVQTTPNPEDKRGYYMKQEKNLMKGKVVDSVGNPIQYATIKHKNAKTIITSDSAGRFKMYANDSSLSANISAPGYKTEEKILSNRKEQVIVMQHDSRDLNEVVVIANGVKRQKKDVGYSTILQGKVPGVVVNDATQPVIGWQDFNEYVKENIKIPVDNEGKNYKGKVVLSFEINKRGNPKKIKVEQPLCKPCDEEATRLLLHGPKWKYVNNKRQKVTIEL